MVLLAGVAHYLGLLKAFDETTHFYHCDVNVVRN